MSSLRCGDDTGECSRSCPVFRREPQSPRASFDSYLGSRVSRIRFGHGGVCPEESRTAPRACVCSSLRLCEQKRSGVIPKTRAYRPSSLEMVFTSDSTLPRTKIQVEKKKSPKKIRICQTRAASVRAPTSARGTRGAASPKRGRRRAAASSPARRARRSARSRGATRARPGVPNDSQRFKYLGSLECLSQVPDI